MLSTRLWAAFYMYMIKNYTFKADVLNSQENRFFSASQILYVQCREHDF